MALKVYDVDAATVDPTIKILVVGEPGAGKTRTASTWPNVLYLNADEGLLSVRDRAVRAIDISSIEDLQTARKMLDNSKAERTRNFGGKPVDTVVIDTLDEVARIVIRERLLSEKRATMQRDDWGHLGDTMRNMVRAFRNIDGLNVIFNCHMKAVEDEETGRVTYSPSIQGAFGGELPGFVDLAVVLKTGMVKDPATNTKVSKRWMQLGADPQYPWLKDRSGSLPAEFEVNFEDDYERMRSLIFGALFRDSAKEALEVAAELKKEATTTTAVEEPPAAEEKPKAAKKAAAKKAAPKPAPAPAVAEEVTEPVAEPADEPVETPSEAAAPEPQPEPSVEQPAEEDDDELARLEAQLEAARAKKAAAAAAPSATEDRIPVSEAVAADSTEASVAEAPVEDVETAEETELDETTEEIAPEDDLPASEAVSAPSEPTGPPPGELPLCAVCQENGVEKQVENKDYADLSMIRFKKPLCRDHFAEAKKG